MNILFRVDSSSEIGIGHLIRCLVLAEQYPQDNITFTSQDLEGNANKLISNKGYTLSLLNDNSIGELMLKINKFKIDMVIFDHYGINNIFEKSIKEMAGVQILSFDDTYEKHYCDILLNHNIYATAEEYKGLVPEFCVIKCGKEHTLIRDEFRKIKIKKRPFNKNTSLIFVSLGGSDAANIGLTVLKMLVEFKNIEISLATTSSNKNIIKLQTFAIEHQNVNIYINYNIAELMNSSDYAIITPSVIVYEAMYLDLPFLAIQTAENQRYISNYLANNHFLIGHIKTLDSIKPLVQSLLLL